MCRGNKICFQDPRFEIDVYQYPPLIRDINSKDGGKIIYIRKGCITKRSKQ